MTDRFRRVVNTQTAISDEIVTQITQPTLETVRIILVVAILILIGVVLYIDHKGFRR